jgi:DNA-binding CsgD family transcriptional regulator
MPALVGRAEEISRLAAILDDVERGRAASLLVRGVAGVGKSRLLDEVAAVAAARDWTVGRAAGTEFEQEMAFTGLASIVGPHLDVVDELDDRYGRALRAALGLDEGSTPQLAVGVALLAFLARLAERRPLLVVVDDLHWLDQASVSALHFAVHRLDADRVLVLFASRPEQLPRSARSLPSLSLDDLDERDVRALLTSLEVSPDVAVRCSQSVGGNPLALLELARRLSVDQRAGRVPLPDPLPLAERLADAYQPLLDALAPPTRRALEVVAVAATGDLTVVYAALDRLGIDRDELMVAEAAGLVTLGTNGLAWVHPLARAAVLHQSGRDARRRVHRTMAEVLDPDRAADQIAWHLASAATEPDEALAAQLEHVGENARRRGALAAAAQAFTAASQLSETDEARAERLRLTGQAMWAGGASAPSTAVMHQAIALTDDPLAQARIVVTLGEAVMWSDGIAPAVEVFERHARAVLDADPDLSAHLAVRAAGGLVVAGDIGRARELAEAADDAAQRSGEIAATFAAGTVRAIAELLAGAPSAIDRLEPITDLTLALLPTGAGGIEMAAQLAGFAACIAERWEQVEELLGGAIAIGEERGLLGLMAIATVIRADGRLRAGRVSEAFSDLTSVAALIDASDETVVGSFIDGYLARVEGLRGMDEPCRRHAASAIDIGDRLGIGSAALMGRHGLAVLELGAGHADRAIEHLDVIARDLEAWGATEPGILWWQPDYVEALVARGRTEEAVAFTERLAEAAGRTERRFATAAVAWCRAIVQDDDAEREGLLTRAADGLTAINAAFELGRVHLARGQCRLRLGDRVEGRRDLAAARTIFAGLGARDWLEQARAVIGDVTREASETRPTLADALTPAELRVALCVGSGATNRQAADQLFVSVKTVDYHLQNIYPKLGVHSRAQLAARVAAETSVTA